jgi:hypothetical protein
MPWSPKYGYYTDEDAPPETHPPAKIDWEDEAIKEQLNLQAQQAREQSNTQAFWRQTLLEQPMPQGNALGAVREAEVTPRTSWQREGVPFKQTDPGGAVEIPAYGSSDIGIRAPEMAPGTTDQPSQVKGHQPPEVWVSPEEKQQAESDWHWASRDNLSKHSAINA